MRYDLKDNGGVKKFSDVDKLVQMYFNKSLREIAKDNNIDSTLWELPFVYVFERKDFSIKLYGFEVFPETVKNAIMSVKSAYKLLTGRFTLEAAHDKKFNQFLKVNLELKKDIRELEVLIHLFTINLV
jgi:phenylacetate-coenzyme A ligase PaaK-like adenylate-forming protein